MNVKYDANDYVSTLIFLQELLGKLPIGWISLKAIYDLQL